MPGIQCGDVEFSGQWSIWSLVVRYGLSKYLAWTFGDLSVPKKEGS